MRARGMWLALFLSFLCAQPVVWALAPASDIPDEELQRWVVLNTELERQKKDLAEKIEALNCDAETNAGLLKETQTLCTSVYEPLSPIYLRILEEKSKNLSAVEKEQSDIVLSDEIVVQVSAIVKKLSAYPEDVVKDIEAKYLAPLRSYIANDLALKFQRTLENGGLIGEGIDKSMRQYSTSGLRNKCQIHALLGRFRDGQSVGLESDDLQVVIGEMQQYLRHLYVVYQETGDRDVFPKAFLKMMTDLLGMGADGVPFTLRHDAVYVSAKKIVDATPRSGDAVDVVFERIWDTSFNKLCDAYDKYTSWLGLSGKDMKELYPLWEVEQQAENEQSVAMKGYKEIDVTGFQSLNVDLQNKIFKVLAKVVSEGRKWGGVLNSTSTALGRYVRTVGEISQDEIEAQLRKMKDDRFEQWEEIYKEFVVMAVKDQLHSKAKTRLLQEVWPEDEMTTYLTYRLWWRMQDLLRTQVGPARSLGYLFFENKHKDLVEEMKKAKPQNDPGPRYRKQEELALAQDFFHFYVDQILPHQSYGYSNDGELSVLADLVGHDVRLYTYEGDRGVAESLVQHRQDLKGYATSEAFQAITKNLRVDQRYNFAYILHTGGWHYHAVAHVPQRVLPKPLPETSFVCRLVLPGMDPSVVLNVRVLKDSKQGNPLVKAWVRELYGLGKDVHFKLTMQKNPQGNIISLTVVPVSVDNWSVCDKSA